ncbi:hypothetical protein TRFO_39891 [Tritrichomonas foetus]|uniref:HCP-like protein n=1 Tax=Tritrichomonas foetus TaxID=1144522 RepID=A0A1J4J9K5_9EUKA|nr:hypothetical protein TRFO_39891 [Tritrichomonas foetus]|eukprot:OHS93924.1 hypothetical protein TRFO_39891 [Tritrichomonas foetus]
MIDEGIKIYNGDGVKRKYANAVNLFIKASKILPEAALWYGKCKFYGNGVNYEPYRAFDLFQQASKAGFQEADYYIGLCYLDGSGIERDQKKAFEIFLKLAHDKYMQANHQLGICYLHGKGTTQNINQAREVFKEGAKNKYILSEFYYTGLLTGKERLQSEASLRAHVKAAIDSDVDVQYEYGKFLKFSNIAEGLKLIKQAASNHHRDAQCLLGKMYYGIEKWCVEIDFQLACKYFRKAANHGSYEAMLYYGLFKIYMKHYEQFDLEEGVKLIKVAANHHQRDALYHYANLLYRGYGVEKNEIKAIEFYKNATREGQMDALVKYCKFLVEGVHIKKDLKEAEYYLKWAANNGCKQAAIDYADLLKNEIIEGGTPELIKDYYKKGGVLIDFEVKPIPIVNVVINTSYD